MYNRKESDGRTINTLVPQSLCLTYLKKNAILYGTVRRERRKWLYTLQYFLTSISICDKAKSHSWIANHTLSMASFPSSSAQSRVWNMNPAQLCRVDVTTVALPTILATILLQLSLSQVLYMSIFDAAPAACKELAVLYTV